MSNVFPDPSQSPWTNPDTGVEFVYDTTVGGWVPADEIASSVGETLDSVCQNDPVTDVDVTVGSLIYMDDGEDAYNGGPHELEARAGTFGEVLNDYSLVKFTSWPNLHAYSPTLNLHVFVGNERGEKAKIGQLGSLEEFDNPVDDGEECELKFLLWAGDRFFGFNGRRSQVWESLDGRNWSVTKNPSNYYQAGSGDTSDGRTVYHAASGKLCTMKYDSGYKIHSSTPGDYSTEDIIDFGGDDFSSDDVMANAPDLVVPCSRYDSSDILAKYSKDGGATWHTLLKSTTGVERIVSYANGEYWGHVTCGTSAVSSDLENWETKPSPTFNYPEWTDSYKPDQTAVIRALPQLYHNGLYVLTVDPDDCGSGWGYNHFILYSKDGVNWMGAMGLGSPTPYYNEYFDMDYKHMFIDSEDNLVFPMAWYNSVFYVQNFTKDVVQIDDGGLYYDGDKVATSENLQPLFQEINSHTDQLAELDGEKLPYNILTLPTQAI